MFVQLVLKNPGRPLVKLHLSFLAALGFSFAAVNSNTGQLLLMHSMILQERLIVVDAEEKAARGE